MSGKTETRPISAEEISHNLVEEQIQVREFLHLFSLPKVDYGTMIYPEWSAKDVFAHIVSWHESFARNIDDLAAGRKPHPFTASLREVNEVGVVENRGATLAALRRRIKAAQATIEQHIFDETIDLIPYRRGGRPYDQAEHLEIVTGHIRDHFWHVVSAFATGKTV